MDLQDLGYARWRPHPGHGIEAAVADYRAAFTSEDGSG